MKKLLFATLLPNATMYEVELSLDWLGTTFCDTAAKLILCYVTISNFTEAF